jgi:hypothetical protein
LKPYHDIQTALNEAIDKIKMKGRTPNLMIIPDGGNTVPKMMAGE